MRFIFFNRQSAKYMEGEEVMRKHFKRLLSLLLTFVMILGLSGITANAAGNKADARIDGAHVYTEAENALLENDVFASISSLRSDAAQAAGGLSRLAEADYIRMVPDVISAIKSSATYVEGSLQQNGNFLVWQTTTGIPCCYDPRMEAKLHGASAPISDEELMAIDRENQKFLSPNSVGSGFNPSIKSPPLRYGEKESNGPA